MDRQRRHLVVKRDKCEEVERDKHIIKRDKLQEIKRDHNLKIKGKEAIEVTGSRSIKVQGDVIEAFRANHSEEVTQDYYVKGMNLVLEGMTGLTIKVGGNFITIDSSGIYIKGTMLMLNSGGAALSGNTGTGVAPTVPLATQIAGIAAPGMDPQEATANNAPWHKEPEEEEEKSWIEIQLVDELDQPVAGERYRITLPDGTTVDQGTTDSNGNLKNKL